MTKLASGLPAFILLAAATTSACAQGAASKAPILHQSGCVDFSAEYEGCLSFGSPPDLPASSGPDRSVNLQTHVDTGYAAPTMESRIASSGVTNTRRQTDAIPPTISSLDRAEEVGVAIGHLGAP